MRPSRSLGCLGSDDVPLRPESGTRPHLCRASMPRSNRRDDRGIGGRFTTPCTLGDCSILRVLHSAGEDRGGSLVRLADPGGIDHTSVVAPPPAWPSGRLAGNRAHYAPRRGDYELRLVRKSTSSRTSKGPRHGPQVNDPHDLGPRHPRSFDVKRRLLVRGQTLRGGPTRWPRCSWCGS
jgi:hypothetical protein